MLSDTEEMLPELYKLRDAAWREYSDLELRINRLQKERSRKFQDEFFAHARKHCPAELGGQP